MTYRILEHTADVRLLVEGRTLEELFAEALRGMMELMQPEAAPEGVKPRDAGVESSREIQVESPAVTALLVDFLNEALSLAHSHREVYEAVEFDEISETCAHAALRGRAVSSFGEDIKAVTYHEAEIRKNAAGNFETILVFDI